MAELLFDQLSPEEKEDVVSFYNSQNMNIGSPLTVATLPDDTVAISTNSTNQRSWRDDAVFGGGSSTSPDPELVRQGTQGAIVNAIQEALNNNGADLVVDGVAGPLTAEAVAEFQRNNDGLIPDGRIGAQTIGALTSNVRPKPRNNLLSPDETTKSKAAQEYLGIVADGDWGKGSTRTLAGWQYQYGLPVSGELDEETLSAMNNPDTQDPRKPSKVNTSVLNEEGTAPEESKVKDWAKDNIKDPVRAAAFVATVEAETGNRDLVELGYLYSGAKSRNRTPSELASKLAKGNSTRAAAFNALAQDPEWTGANSDTKNDMIFDIYYDDQYRTSNYKLGNTEQGDGSTFKGRGLVQMTGRSNYDAVGKILGIDLLSNPELVNDPKYAAPVAMAYLSLPGKDFFSGTMTRDYLKSVVGHSGGSAEAQDRWDRTNEVQAEMYP